MSEIYKGLDKLDSRFRAKVELWLTKVGDRIFITESWRSQDRQKELYSIGRQTQGRVVTWTLDSMHTSGLAVDIAFRSKELYPKDMDVWRDVADIARDYGIDWGYDLWARDMPHFQDNGKDLEVNKNKMKYKKEFEEEVNLGFTPLFKDHAGDESLTESESKYLDEIACSRLFKRIKDYIDQRFANLKNNL